MMELTTCAFVVTLVSLVTASPYGYGVKGGAGASARAQSSASAGAFGDQGDIPVAIPFGNGFSGSFSKSSSSSTSSSSASSSSSSSSFSFNGSGSGGFSGQGTHGNIGCKSGLCPNLGSNEISGNHGSTGTDAGLHGFSAANAAAAAGSGASSGAGCGGSSCDSNTGKCSSGKCQSKPLGENDNDTNNKCTSGLCGPTTQSGPSASSNDETEDIRVLPHSSKSSLDSKDQSANYDKTTGHIGADCSGNKCGPSTGYSQPNFGPVVSNSYQNNPQPSNSASKPGYHSPSTELETPKHDSKSSCTSGFCNSEQPEPVHGSSPSSYNVPIHGTYDNNNQKPTCTNGICTKPLREGYHSTYSNVLPTNYLSPQDSHSPKEASFNYPGLPNCRGTNCDSASSSQISNKPFVTGPVTINANMPLHNIASLSPTNCNLPNCNPQYAASSTIGSNTPSKPVTFSGTAHKVKPSNDDKPIYTGGFGAPAGILKPNDYTIPAIGLNPNYEPVNSGLHITPAFGISATECGSSNCLDQISSPETASYNSNESQKPRGDQNNSEQKPKYTGGFGGPAGLLKPNEFNIYTPTVNKPNQSTSLTHNTPSTSASCTTPDCFGSSPIGGISSPIPGSAANLPPYTSDFGRPAVTIKPNELDTKISKKPLLTTNPPYQNHQHILLPTTGCKTSNCNGYSPVTGTTSGTYVQTESYGTIKPSLDIDTTSKLSAHAGGYGNPNKPNQFNLPHAAPNNRFPNHSGTPPNTSPFTNVAGCATPNCRPSSFGTTIAIHSQPQFGINQPNITPRPSSVTNSGYTSNYGKPVGIMNPVAPAVAPISSYTNNPPFKPSGINSEECKTANCAVGSSSLNHPSASSSESKPFNTHFTYGPTSKVTPNNISYNVPFDGTNSNHCKTSNCANLPSAGAGANAQSGSHGGSKDKSPPYTSGFGAPPGVLKPNDYSIPSPPASVSPGACSGGNCNSQVTSPSSPGYNSAPSGSHPSTQSSSPQYSGGFGGPSGFENPGDHSYNAPSSGSLSTPCKTANCAVPSPATSGTGAPSGSPHACSDGNCKPQTTQPSSPGYSSISSGSYPHTQPSSPSFTGGFGGPSGTAKPVNHLYNIPSTGGNTIACNTPNCAISPTAGTGVNAQSSADSDSKNQSPPYTSGFGAPSGLLKPNDYSIPSSPASATPGACSGGNCNPQVTSPSSPGYISAPSGSHPSAPPSSPQYTGSFGGPSGIAKPNDLSSGNHHIPCKTANCAIPSTATAGANGPSGLPGACSGGNCNPQITSPSSPGQNLSPSGSHPSTQPSSPHYTGTFGGPSGIAKPGDHLYTEPSTGGDYNPCKTANCALSPTAASAVHAQAGSHAGSKDQSPPYTSGFGAPSGFLKPNDKSAPAIITSPNNYNKPSPAANSPAACSGGNCNLQITSPSLPGYNSATSGSHPSPLSSNPQYTGGFTGPSGTAKPGDYSYNVPSAGSSSIPCKTANCAGSPIAPTRPYTTPQDTPYTSDIGAPSSSSKPSGYPSTVHTSYEHDKPLSSGSSPGACSNGYCDSKVTSPSSYGYGSAPSGSHSSSQPSSPQYTGGFGGPTGTAKPGDHSYNVPSTGSNPIPCKSSNCAISPSVTAGANAQSGSPTGSKDQSPPYTSGFGAPPGFLKPNDYSIPATASPKDQTKPSQQGSSPSGCTSGNCNAKEPSPISHGHNAVSNGAHASASSTASAVAYTGGFGGPPGFLKPNDDGKVDLAKLVGGYNQGSHHGAGSNNSPHDVFNASAATPAGAHSNAGAVTGSLADATAYSGSVASANSGSYGFNTHGTHQAGGVKGSSPCGGGCGGHQHGLSGSGSSAVAGARSLASAGAFGGSFASSSASAHASAGSYTKGGYGKR